MNDLNPPSSSVSARNLKSWIADEESVIRERHANGASGEEIVQRRTSLIDRLLKDIHDKLSIQGPIPALIAVGGYGRGELNPRSDIDIMFLCRNETDRKCAPDMLYALWDAGLDIGYSVRTIDECVELGRNDSKIRTSLLESRLLAGSSDLYRTFISSMQSNVFFWKTSRFLTEKLAERASVRQNFGGSLYLREPNIKESSGGLRDVHTAFWIVFSRFRTTSIQDMVSLGIVSDRQLSTFLRSRNFLWRIRNELHFQSGRKQDQLSFDMQESAAAAFHYRDSTHLLAVERFMKNYFLHARNVQDLSRIIIEGALPAPRRAWFSRKVPIGPFMIVDRTLIASSPGPLPQDPAMIMQAFQIKQTHHVQFSNALRDHIRRIRLDHHDRSSPKAAVLFREVLSRPDDLADTLVLMKELDFLGKYLPEFRDVQALARHDYYHKYTVDEHILLAIRHLEDVGQGRYPGLETLAQSFHELSSPWILFFSLLLHDLGKAYRHDHEKRGVDIAARILDRLGITGRDRETIFFLIGNHLVMTTLSQRRELSDEQMIDQFCKLIGDKEKLNMLYLLTYADISAVSPTAWTSWKATLLQDLYLRARSRFEQKIPDLDHKLITTAPAIARVQTAGAHKFTSDAIASFLSIMPEKYRFLTSPSKILMHMNMVERLPAEHLTIRVRHRPEKGHTELTICAYDSYGIFYRTAGTIAAQNLNIQRAQIFTGKTGIMIDTFQITDAEGNITTYDDVWKTIEDELRHVLMGSRDLLQPRKSGVEKYLPGPARPNVIFDNETSRELTIIDISARDRMGLLYLIAKTLYELNLDVASAKIVTEGTRAMDSFYVSDLLREKITDPDRLAKIRDVLMAILT